MRRDTRLLLLLIATLVLGTGGALLLEAQKPDLPPLAAVSADGLWLYGQGDEPQPVTAAGGGNFFDLTWSPDGSTLAYFVGGATMPRLWVVDRANTTQTRLAVKPGTTLTPNLAAARAVFFISSAARLRTPSSLPSPKMRAGRIAACRSSMRSATAWPTR